MTLNKIEVFYLVANSLNMSAVARKLDITQPAISQIIKELEKEYTSKFFNRLGKNLELTPEGHTFYNYARRILNISREAKETLESFRLEEKKIKVGVAIGVQNYFFKILSEIKKDMRESKIEIIIKNSSEIYDLVMEGKIDMGLLSSEFSHEQLESFPVVEDEIVIISEKKNDVSYNNLSKEIFVLREEKSSLMNLMKDIFVKENIEVRKLFEVSDNFAVAKAVSLGLGIGFVPESSLDGLEKNFNIYKFPKLKASLKFNLVYTSDKILSEKMSKLVRLISR
ncbi:MAG: LysR substrate-binding domain-containing protein [Fusobacteriaceae bacterium]